MSRLFQPSGLPIPERRNANSKDVNPYNEAEISGHIVPSTSKIFQTRSSTAGVLLQDANTRTNIFPEALSKTTKVQMTISKTSGEKIIDPIYNPTIRAGSPYRIGKSVVVPIPPPFLPRKELSLQLKSMVSKAPKGAKVIATGVKRIRVAPLGETMTPSGPQKVLNKLMSEKRIERTKHGEIVAENLRTIRTDISSEEPVQIEEAFQKFNPDFPTPKGFVKEIVSVVNERDLTTSYEISRKNIVQQTTKFHLPLGIHLKNLQDLVEEEGEDISNVLKNAVPELVDPNSKVFSLKKRLQKLILSPENIRILTQSIIAPPINAAFPVPEASPELISTLMDISEKAAYPTIPTEQLFNSLFEPGRKENPIMFLSSATPGPMEDVVIPTVVHQGFQEAMLSKEMEQVSALVHLTDKRPPNDAFSKLKPSQPKRRGRRTRPYEALSDEDSPWSNYEALRVSIEAVGALPRFSLRATDVEESVSHGTLGKETSKGIEYIIDCQSDLYSSKVQLRGTQPPPWFPGYMVALSDVSGSVSLAKSPSEVLLSAWKSVQPEVFPDDSVVYN